MSQHWPSPSTAGAPPDAEEPVVAAREPLIIDAELPRARNWLGAVRASDYDSLHAHCSALLREFLRTRDAYSDLVAREASVRASEEEAREWATMLEQSEGEARDRIATLEAEAKRARERIATLERSEGVARERIATLQAAALEADRIAQEEVARVVTTAQRDAATAQERIAALQSASEVRERRVALALADAATVVDGLEFAVKELAALAEPGGGGVEDQDLGLVLQRLFPRLVSAVSISSAESAPPEMLAALQQAAGGRRTWEADDITDAGERPLDASGALANGVVVLARYEPKIFPDGDLPGLVERVCQALAASLAARRRARARAGDRGRVTLLADETALDRLRVLRESQGCEVARVSVLLGAQLKDDQLGLYGAPALSATIFDCAGQLDRLARDHGGEAFELEGAICCLVERRHCDAVASAARQIAVTLGLETEVILS
jgi:hypothetical protein